MILGLRTSALEGKLPQLVNYVVHDRPVLESLPPQRFPGTLLLGNGAGTVVPNSNADATWS